MRRKFGEPAAEKLQQRLVELKGASSLSDIAGLPQMKCHQLAGDLDGQLAVTVHGGLRLVFAIDHSPLPTKEDGGLDWTRVTNILVTDVADYH